MSSLELWPKQQEALEFALSRDEVALLCEQRSGKTYVTMALLSHLCDQPEEFVGVLVALLNNKESTWMDGLARFLPDLQVFTDLIEFRKAKGNRLLIVHFEQLGGIIGKLCKYKKLNWAAVDEAHRLSSRGTKQSRAMARLSWVKRKLILTGTPIEKEPQNMWAQLRFLVPDLFGKRYEDFEKGWMDFRQIDLKKYKFGSAGWEQAMMRNRILRKQATFQEDRFEEFAELIKPYSFRMTKEDVGIKPPKVIRVRVPMSSLQRKLYKKLSDDSLVRTPKGGWVTAPMAVTLISKQRQLASGFLYTDDEEMEWIGTPKLDRLMALIERLPKPVVVFTAFRPETGLIHDLVEKQGYNTVKVCGKTKKALRPDIWRNFQRGQYDVIVCQIRTGGVGVDLWKANHAIVYSMNHSFIDWDQAKARLDAKHKRKPARIYVLCSEGSIDEELYDLVLLKELTGAKVLKHLKHERTRRWPKPPKPPRRPAKVKSRAPKPSSTRSATWNRRRA